MGYPGNRQQIETPDSHSVLLRFGEPLAFRGVAGSRWSTGKRMRLSLLAGELIGYAVGIQNKGEGGQKDSDTDQRPTGNVILRLSAVARARQSGSEGSVNCPRGFLSTFRPLLSFSFNGVFLDPSSPVVNVSFDRREEAGCDRLRDALALLPRSHRIDIDTKESRQHRLARPE